MTICFSPTIDTFLRQYSVISLSAWAQGQLWAASVIYCLDGERRSLIYYSDPHTLHGSLTAMEPTVAATIAPQIRVFALIQGLQLSGTTRELQGIQRDRAVPLFSDQYPTVGEPSTAIWELTPHYIKFVDNSIPFGHKEIWREQ